METDFTPLRTQDQIDEHVFELYSLSASDENQNLGFISSNQNPLHIQIEQEDFTIEQSPTLLSSNSISSTTGYVAWKLSPLFLRWLLHHEANPFHRKLDLKTLRVLELGSGSAGLVASCLGAKVAHFVASDQAPLLKLLKRNIVSNVGDFDSSTITSHEVRSKKKSGRSRIDAIELDWEWPEAGARDLQELQFAPDLIVLCDNIYNEYLIPHFLSTLAVVASASTTILVLVHLRDFEIVQQFLEQACRGFRVSYVPHEYLTEELQSGFAIYHLIKTSL